MILTPRDREIVAAVSEFGILTRTQLARHLKFGSVTRVNAVLLRLVRHAYLTRRTQATLNGSRRQLYMLGPLGSELRHGERRDELSSRRRWRESSDLFVEHRLLVNDVRLALRHVEQPEYRLRLWKTEQELRHLDLGLVPDAYAEYELGGRVYALFVEADNGTETRGRWHQKTVAYVDLGMSGRFLSRFGRQFFRVLVVVPSPRRLESVRGEIARHTDRMFWLTTFADITTSGPFGRIWRRPKGVSLESLIP